ncbi:conserved uncharacterized protein, DUF610 [Desulfosarcina variabilis str. Montpellier]|uniref:divergent polysaccharide deacetylase family protein n=1 Tax=Desulfosarcina variabilis TaxID=2300 RepID=UPI003AFA6589
MVKKKKAAKSKARKTKKKKTGVNYKLQFMKIAAGLALIICLIVTAGLLTNRLLMKQPPTVASKQKPVPVTRPEPGRAHHSIPDYEAFPRETVPPPPPITRRKPVTNGIPVAIIIDDIGYDKKMADGFLALDVPLTFSLLPMGTFNHRIIDKAIQKNVEIMLHQPMEPSNYPKVNPGPGALLTSMNPDELIAQLNTNLDSLPSTKGVNNHMGSKLTASSHQMRQVFTILKKRGLFFVDSRTTADTCCRESAELLKLPFAERDVFLDHEQTPAFVRKQIKQLMKRAKQQGYAIAIGHPHTVTLTVLKEMLPELKKTVSLTHASDVVAFQQG